MTEALQPEQQQQLVADLHALQADLQRQLEASRDGARPVDLDEPIGRLTRMDAMQQQAMTRATRRDVQVRLNQVLAALSRIGEGDYGFCLQCDEPIGFARLKVKPEAATCVDCQSRHERRLGR